MKNYLIPLLFISYFIVGYIPNYFAVDKNATQFLYLSVLNSFTIITLLYNSVKLLYINRYFFYSLGAYSIWALLSYFYAFNQQEVFIHTNKILIYFISIACIYTLLKNAHLDNSRIVLIFLILLLVEIIWINYLFLDRYKLIGRDLGLRAFTGNINITGIALLFKLPIIIYGINKFKGYFKYCLIVILPVLVFTILLMGSRLSNLILFSLFIGFLFYKILWKKNVIKYSTILIFGVSIILSLSFNFLIFKDSSDNAFERTSSALARSESTNQRLRFYEQAFDHIANNPFIGTGAGNWKIQSIIYENKFIRDYVIPYHAHNDFLESATELGIIGFLLNYSFYFILLFLLIFYFRELLKSDKLILFLIPSIIIFLLDSTFNFPHDRPIIMTYNWIFIGLLFSKVKIKSRFFDEFKIDKKFVIVLLVLSFGTSVISKKVYDSFVDQNDLIVGMMQDSYYLSEAELFDIDSNFPSIGATTVPMDIYKANYLLNQNKLYDTILDFIEKGAKKNPYLYSQHALKSVYYLKKKNVDSALMYAEKAYYGLSNNRTHFRLYTDILAALKDSIGLQKAYSVLKNPIREGFTKKYLKHLNTIKTNFDKDDSLLISELSEKNMLSDFGDALNIINQVGKDNVFKGVDLSIDAEGFYEIKNYLKAGELFLKASKLNPKELAYFENAANCFMKIGQNKKALEILIEAEKNLQTNGKTQYLLSIIYYDIGDKEKSCFYINKAKQMGFKSTQAIYTLFCYDEK